jgi:SPP1 gp7 family putative phage head morphogenesis protein
MAWRDALRRVFARDSAPTLSSAGSAKPAAVEVDPRAEPTEQPLLESTAYAGGSALYALALAWPRYNPDVLLSRQGLAVYDQMMADEQVKAVMKFKRDAILSRQWSFKFDDDSALSPEEKKRRIDVMGDIVDRMKGSFIDSLTFILRAMRHGFSVTEKIYDLIEVDSKSYYACVELRPKPPFSFYFITDEFGTLQRFGQNYGGQLRDLDVRKFIHHVNDPEEDPWFGRSELRAAYRSWYSKDVLIKLQNLWMERMAGGFIVVSADKEAPGLSKSERQALNDAIANVKTISGVVLPPGYKAENLAADGETGFEKVIEYHDLAIAKALLVPNLLGISHTGQTGAYAQSQTQLEAFFWTLNSDSKRLEATLNEQMFYELCELNFGDGEYPCFEFKPASEEFVKWVVGQWSTLVSANAVITTEADEMHLRQILNMPSRSEADKPLVTPSQAQAGKIADAKLAQAGGESAPDAIDPSGAENYRAHTKDGKPRTCSVEAFSRASSRVAFSVIERKAEQMASDGKMQLARVMATAIARAVQGASDALKNPTAAQDMAFKSSDMQRLNTACRTILQGGWDLGQRQAVKELESARKTPMVRKSFRALRDQAAEYLAMNGFRMAGNLADGARAIIQQELLNGIKAGDRPEIVKAHIFERLVSKGFVTLGASLDVIDDEDTQTSLKGFLGSDIEIGAASYLETLARTNLFEAMNEARFNEFTDPELDGFVEALEYSAILDDRTTEICQALDGDVFKADSDEWDIYRPPNHYNCRSVLIPVTKVDGWDGQESETPSVQPQAGFGAGEK